MATKTYCDVCEHEMGSDEQGYISIIIYDGHSGTQHMMDANICSVHHTELKDMFRTMFHTEWVEEGI